MGDRDFEIRTHAHRQCGESVARGDIGEEREMRRRLFVNRRHAHQTFDREFIGLAAGLQKSIRVLREHAEAKGGNAIVAMRARRSASSVWA